MLNSIWNKANIQSGSCSWKKIYRSSGFLFPYCDWVVGNGKKIDIWYDQWLQRAQIAPLFPNYSFPYDDRLSKLAFDGIWQVPPSLPADIANFLSRNLSQVHPPQAHDNQLIWIGHPFKAKMESG